LSLIKFFKIFAFFLYDNFFKKLSVRTDFFGSAAGGLPAEALVKAGGRRAGVANREAAS